jgi:hypothetical protein
MADEPLDDTPFSEDCVIAGAARLVGMDVRRSQSIIVTDRKALEAAGLVRKSPDLWRIRQLLNDGAEVQGAHLGPMEYTLRKKEQTNVVDSEENGR